MKSLISLLFLASVVSAGHVLFFMPAMPKSSTMTFTPLAEKLASKGHKVTVVNPYPIDKKYPTLKEFVIKHDFATEMDMSKDILTGNLTSWGILMTMNSQWDRIFGLTHSIYNELKHDHKFFDQKVKYDAVVSYGFMPPNLLGYHIARKHNASMIMYSAVQVSALEYDLAMGQPHSPAVIPFMISTYRYRGR